MLYRSGGVVAVVATLTGVLAGIDVAPPTVTLLSARYVRSIDTAELGIPSPRGISFLADTGALLVQGEGATELSITTGGDRVDLPDGAARSAQDHAPDLTARQPTTGSTYVLDPAEDLLFERAADGTAHATYRLAELDLADPRGMTFAPSADQTDDPDQQHLFIADAGDRDTAGGIMEVSLEPGLTLAATVPVVTAQLVQTIDTSRFSPASPDPSGIVHLPGSDRMQIVDSEVDETTGAGYHNVNLWQVTRTGSVTDTGTTWTGGAGYSREPTGLGYIPATNTLLVSDDTADRVWLDRPGADGRHGTADDVVSWISAGAYGSGDTEDPEFDPATGHIFFIDGTNLEVYEVDPVNGVFGDGNDVMTHFDVAKDGMRDVEGLSSDPARGTLLVGDRNLAQIFEYTKTGELVRIIDASGISALRFISGLAFGPASNGSGNNYWTVDRAVDNGANSNENDGKIFELHIGGASSSAPVAVPDSASTAEDAAVTVNVAANDTDPDGNLVPGSVTVTVPPANGTASPNGNGTVTYTPVANFNGTNTFTYRICDATSLCATATVTVTVTPVADAPVAVADAATTLTATAVTIDVAANDTDPDGDLVPGSVTVTVPPANGTASPNGNGTVTYTPVASFNGTNTFTYRICDATSLCATATVTVTVIAADPPVAVDDSASTAEDAAVTVNVAANDTDPDGDLVPGSVTVTVPPANGTASPNGNGTVTYTPVASFNGTNTFTYRICDATSLCATATVTVTVTPVADAPVAVADTVTTEEATAVTIDVAANDTDPDGDLVPGSVTVTVPPANGTASPNGNGTVTYTPVASFNGTNTFTYRICDATSLCATATVTVTVGRVNRYYVSLDSNGTVAGAGSVRDEDIIVYDPATSSWAMYFDASDVGISTSDLEDFHVRADGSILMSFSSALNVPGLTGGPDGTLVDDSDIVLFTPTSTGATTSGTFSFYFDGSDVGLAANSERLDGIHELSDGTLLLSTTGSASVPGLSGADEDILWFSPSSTGAITTGTWIGLYFDGSDVGLTSSNDDLDAIVVDANGDLLYSTVGDNTVPGTLDEDINRFTGTYGANTSGTATLELAFASLGIATSNDVDGLAVGR